MLFRSASVSLHTRARLHAYMHEPFGQVRAPGAGRPPPVSIPSFRRSGPLRPPGVMRTRVQALCVHAYTREGVLQSVPGEMLIHARKGHLFCFWRHFGQNTINPSEMHPGRNTAYFRALFAYRSRAPWKIALFLKIFHYSRTAGFFGSKKLLTIKPNFFVLKIGLLCTQEAVFALFSLLTEKNF